jgi:hypothetical protein
MAVMQQQIARVKPCRNNTTAAPTKSCNNRKPPRQPSKGVGRKRNTACNQKAANQPELKPGEGGSNLLRAINRRALLECDLIARAIVQKAKDGDISGLRLLADLTGAKVLSSQPPKKPRPRLLPSSAEYLAGQAKWHSQSDPEVDTGFGGREPEN